MKIIGIDPGYAIAGYGIVEYIGNKFKVLEYGAITTDSKTPFPQRLCALYEGLDEIIKKHKPDFAAFEELFFNTNVKTAIAVGHARGVLILSAQRAGVPVYQYTPLQIKQAVTGYGRADKMQMQAMIKALLGLSKVPKPDDAADGLAVAVCHAHSYRINKISRGLS